MKIVVTGSLGHISKPLTQILIKKGHSVTVISSNQERKRDIEDLGATAAIGKLQDKVFLVTTFRDADVVYCMEPPFNFFEPGPNPAAYWINIAENYVQAILEAGVTKVIHLSSIGAHTANGVGILATHHAVEKILKTLPVHVSIKFLRPVGFYYNMLSFIPTIKTNGSIIQNYGGNNKEPWVSPFDIAAVIGEEIGQPFMGRAVRYIASDEVSADEVATILGSAIGKPGLKWSVIPDKQYLENLLVAGLNPVIAKGLVEMNKGRRHNLYDDYFQNRPALGKIKLQDFATEFAAAYNIR